MATANSRKQLSSRPRILPLLILIPSSTLSLLHPHSSLLSILSVTATPVIANIFITYFRTSSGSGTTHGIELTLPLELDGADSIVNDLLRGTDSAVLFMIFDWCYLECLALEFKSM